MDYFLKKLDRKISISRDLSEYGELKILLQVKIEYSLFFLMAIYREKNYQSLDIDEKEYVNEHIINPTIGDIVNIILTLSKYESKATKKLIQIIQKYPNIRNNSIGHGYVFEDGIEIFVKILDEIIDAIEKVDVIQTEYNYILISSKDDKFYKGINCSLVDGLTVWKKDTSDCMFMEDNTYVMNIQDKSYIKVSPFIYISNNEEIFVYSKVLDPLLCRIEYNQIFSTNRIQKEWTSLDFLETSNDDKRKIFKNKTIVNYFDKNYSTYFEIGIKDSIKDFLEKNKSMVACTIWGHGGVGKTAVIQSIIEEYKFSYTKKFDYIVFLSAKDRLYNYKNGKIEDIRERSDSFVDIVKKINEVIGNDNSTSVDTIYQLNGRILIVIDDLETFNQSELSKIQNFISNLNINTHKVVLTTRSNSVIGQEIKTNELSIDQTIDFLKNIFNTDLKNSTLLSQLTYSNYEKIHSLTSGRPLFIYQMAYLMQEIGYKSALQENIKESENAVHFLYGRIYDYLPSSGKNIFIAIGQLIQTEDRTGAISVIKYVLDMEDDSDNFNDGFAALLKLKVIELKGNEIYRVYSNEILKIMKNYYDKKLPSFPYQKFDERNRRLHQSSANDIDNILLEEANNSRSTQSKEDVIKAYEVILSRKSASMEIKLEALMQYSSYLYNDLADFEETNKLLTSYYSTFKNQPEYIQFYSSVLWASRLKKQSIKVLDEYLTIPDFSSQKNLQLFCSLAIKKSIYLIEKRESIKSSYDYDTKEKLYAQRKDFYEFIEHIGNKILQYIYTNDISKLEEGTLQNLFSAVFHCINAYCRVLKFSEILNYKSSILKKFELYSEMHDKLKAKFELCEEFKKQTEEKRKRKNDYV